MNEIKIYLKPSGSIAELYKDFNLYTGSYQNVLMSIYVPTSLLWKNEQGTYSNSVKVGALLTAPNGTKITTNAYYANYISEVTENNISYALYSLNLPKEFATYSGTQTVVVNVVAIDNTNPSAPVVLQVTTTQVVGLTVLLSAYLSQDDILTPSEVEIINGQIELLQQDVSGLKSGTISAGTANYYQQSDGSQSPETIEQALDNIPIVTANPQTVGTEELTALKVNNTVYNVPNMEISFGNEPDPSAFPLNTMTINGDTFRFVGEKGEQGEQGPPGNAQYSVIITTLGELETQISANWAGVTSVLFDGANGEFALENNGIQFPPNVKEIEGRNNAIFTITNFVYSSNNPAALWANTYDTSIKNITVKLSANSISASAFSYFGSVINCVAESSGIGFQSCRNIINSKSTVSGVSDNFIDCEYLVNCSASGGDYGYQRCGNLTNCVCTNIGVAGFIVCSNVSNSKSMMKTGLGQCYSTCSHLVNCVAMDGSAGYSNCSYCSNCGTSNISGSFKWQGTNTKVDTDSCDTNDGGGV